MPLSDPEHLARLVAVWRSTVDTMPHPIDDPAGWAARWRRLRVLADEIDAAAGLTPGE